jgi:hypothetical protein
VIVLRPRGMARYGGLLILSHAEREELTRWSQSHTLPCGDVFRARLILALANGFSYREIEERLNTNSPTIARWRGRFEQVRIEGLQTQASGQPSACGNTFLTGAHCAAHAPGAARRQHALDLSQAGPRPSQSASRQMKAQLKTHPLDRYMASNDPEFECKAADIVGLYLNLPQHAAMFCVDEKTAIQALDRLHPVLPLSPGGAERHGFEYCRHGTLGALRRAGREVGQGHGQDGQAAHQRRLHQLSHGGGRTNQVGPRDSYRSRQSVGP